MTRGIGQMLRGRCRTGLLAPCKDPISDSVAALRLRASLARLHKPEAYATQGGLGGSGYVDGWHEAKAPTPRILRVGVGGEFSECGEIGLVTQVSDDG